MMVLNNIRDYFKTQTGKTLALLFLLSLAVRIGCWLLAAGSQIEPHFDELTYYSWGTQIEAILDGIARGDQTFNDLWQLIIVEGSHWWPPLNSILLALWMFVFGTNPATARLVPVIASTMTTIVVYLLTLKMSTRRTALAASLIHIFYPSFVAFSHYLWSESVYFLLMLSGVYFSILLLEAEDNRPAVRYAVLSGAALGLAGLARATILPLLVAVPGWVFLLKKGWPRLILPAVIIGAWVLVLSPWVVPVSMVEQRFVPIATTDSHNFYAGNNPWIPEDVGNLKSGKISASIKEYAEEHGVSENRAAKELAFQEIKRDPGLALKRSMIRLRILLAPDTFVMRHIFYVIYPPVSPIIVAVVWLGVLVSHLFLLLLTVWGAISPGEDCKYRFVLLTLILATIAPPLITISSTRIGLPTLILSLPLAGWGLINLRRDRYLKWKAIAACPAILAWVILAQGHLDAITRYEPTGRYAALFKPVAGVLPDGFYTRDQILLRTLEEVPSYAIDISVEEGQYTLKRSGADTSSWDVFPGNEEHKVNVLSADAAEPPIITFESEKTGETATIDIQTAAWREWTPLGIGEIEYYWDGR